LKLDEIWESALKSEKVFAFENYDRKMEITGDEPKTTQKCFCIQVSLGTVGEMKEQAVGECEYEAALGELTAADGAQPLYLNGNPIAGVFVKKQGNNYYLVDAEGKAVTVDGYTSWQYDAKTGALYNSRTEQTSVIFFFNWNFSHGGTKTTKYYLNADANDKLFVSCKPQVARYPEVGEHEWAYTVNEDGTHTATCKNCNKEGKTEDHDFDATSHECLCGKLDPSVCKITAVKVKDVNTVLTSPLWLFKRLFFIARNTYSYQITTEGNMVKAAKVETSVNGEEGTWKTGVLLTSDLKLNELYIRITDTNGEVSNWYWDGEEAKNTDGVVFQCPQLQNKSSFNYSYIAGRLGQNETAILAQDGVKIMGLDTNKKVSELIKKNGYCTFETDIEGISGVLKVAFEEEVSVCLVQTDKLAT